MFKAERQSHYYNQGFQTFNHLLFIQKTFNMTSIAILNTSYSINDTVIIQYSIYVFNMAIF